MQLRRVVDRLSLKERDQRTDGDEEMICDGHVISKFSREAMHVEKLTCMVKEKKE